MDWHTEMGILGGSLAFMAFVGFGILTWLLFNPFWPFLTVSYILVNVMTVSIFIFAIRRYLAESPGVNPTG